MWLTWNIFWRVLGVASWNKASALQSSGNKHKIIFDHSSVMTCRRLQIQKTYKQQITASVQSVQSLSRVRLFATSWTAARQVSLSITNSRSLPKLMSIESVMPSNHLILCRHLLLLLSIFSSIRVFSNESALCWGGQSTGVSASASVLPMNTQDWSLLGWTWWISLLSKGLARVFSNTAVQNHQFFCAQLSL